MAHDFWIAEIKASLAMQQKLREKHYLTIEEVRAACIPDTYESAGWETDGKHGTRLLVRTRDKGGTMIVYLMPIDVREGIWRLRTAWRIK